MIPVHTIENILIAYTNGANHQALFITDAKIMVMIGSFAEHGINVVVISPILFSLILSMVAFAIRAGTPHPVAITRGIKFFPDRQKLLKILSRIKATLVIYPDCSRNDRNKNRHAI